eukprot:6893659-Karenia_brevis.AAC.1
MFQHSPKSSNMGSKCVNVALKSAKITPTCPMIAQLGSKLTNLGNIKSPRWLMIAHRFPTKAVDSPNMDT